MTDICTCLAKTVSYLRSIHRFANGFIFSTGANFRLLRTGPLAVLLANCVGTADISCQSGTVFSSILERNCDPDLHQKFMNRKGFLTRPFALHEMNSLMLTVECFA